MKNYRDKLSTSCSPMVPFLRNLFANPASYLKDLTFINDGNARQMRGMINIDKLRMMAGRVQEITLLAAEPFIVHSNPALLNYISKPHIEKDINKLKEMAYILEPPEK